MRSIPWRRFATLDTWHFCIFVLFWVVGDCNNIIIGCHQTPVQKLEDQEDCGDLIPGVKRESNVRAVGMVMGIDG